MEEEPIKALGIPPRNFTCVMTPINIAVTPTNIWQLHGKGSST